MKPFFRRLRQIPSIWWATPVIAVALGALVQRQGGFTVLENATYDLRLRAFSPSPAPSAHFLLVRIDDTTLYGIRSNPRYARNFGGWPYARRLWSRVGQYMLDRGAKAVVFDAVMGDPQSDPLDDLVFGKWLRGKPFYLGFKASPAARSLPKVHPVNVLVGAPRPEVHPASGFSGLGGPAYPPLKPTEAARALAFPVEFEGMKAAPLEQVDAFTHARRPQHPVPPIPPVARNGTGFGLVEHQPDSDGVIRRTRFAFTDGSDTYVDLPIAVAADLLGAERLELSPGRLRLGSRVLRINRDGSALLDFEGPLRQRFPSVTLLDVLDDSTLVENHQKPRLPEDEFRGKVVLIGGSSLGTYDVKATPFSPRVTGSVKVLSELASLLHGAFIVDARPATSYGLALLLALLTVLSVWGTRSVWVELGGGLVTFAVLFVGTGELLTRGHLHVLFVMPAFAAGLSALAAITVNRLTASHERERMKAIFSRYVDKRVVEQLVNQPELPRLDGESREITAFFSDIKGFSTFSEGFKDDPRGLVRVLNTYLTRVSAVLTAHGGCLDKYIGDAVVCIFGAPLKMEDHAVRACRAALAVQKEISRMREEFQARGLPDVYTRIGINSATMFVGNFGSEQLFNYTAMGDGMNLASRLEGANKPYGSRIMIGEGTYALAKAHVEVRELDRVKVAGKDEAVTVYELLAGKGELSEPRIRVVAAYGEALALYRAGRFAEAMQPLEAALALEPADGPSKALLQRCRTYVAHPPEAFDGVVRLGK